MSMTTEPTDTLPVPPNPKLMTSMQRDAEFKDQVLKVFGRQTYVANFCIGHIPEKRFIVGPNLESVKARVEKWCMFKRYRFTSVHPFFFDIEKEIRELESNEGEFNNGQES